MKKPAFNIFLLVLLVLILAPGKSFSQQTDEQLGIQYYQEKAYDKAEAIFEGLFNKNPTIFNYIYYTNCLLEQKEYEKAEKVIRRQGKANPTDPRYDIDLGYIYIMEGETQKGRKIYDESLRDLKADKPQVYNLANAFMTRRENEYAIRTYLKGRDLLKDKTAFAFELSYMYEALGNVEPMLDEYLVILTSQPNQLTMIEGRLQAWLSMDTENERNDAFRTLLLKRTQQNPDEIVYAELLLWYSIQQKDFSLAFIQARALDRRYSENGQRIFDLAALAVSNNDFSVAIDAYNYIIKKDADADLVLESRIELLNTEYEQLTSSYVQDRATIVSLEQKYTLLLGELGKGPATLPLMQKQAHLEAFYLDKTDEAIDLLEEAVSIPNAQSRLIAECKLELADIYLFSGNEWEATLLYQQVEKAFKNEPLGHEAKFRNAKLYFYIGEFGWAGTQLDILKAATSKLIANDAMELSLLISDNIDVDSNTTALSMYARADLLVYRNQYDQAMIVLDSIEKDFPGHAILDDVLFKRAEISEKEGLFEKAAIYYTTLIKDYSSGLLADDATFNLANLFETKLNDKGKAQQLYQDLMTNFPGSLYVVEARKRFRELREDKVN